MTVLRLEPVAGTALERGAAVVDEVTFVRRADGCFAQVRSYDASRMVRALAYAGIDARESTSDLSAPRDHLPAVADDLAPAPMALVTCDIVRVRRLHLGEATAEVLRRRLAAFHAPSAAAQARCRLLLEGEEALFAWERHGWVERARLRALRSRSSLRPIVFDRGALERDERRGRSFASDGALAAWAFG